MLRNICLGTFVCQDDLKCIDELSKVLRIEKNPQTIGDLLEYYKQVDKRVNELLSVCVCVNTINDVNVALNKFKKLCSTLSKEVEIYVKQLEQSKKSLHELLNSVNKEPWRVSYYESNNSVEFILKGGSIRLNKHGEAKVSADFNFILGDKGKELFKRERLNAMEQQLKRYKEWANNAEEEINKIKNEK